MSIAHNWTAAFVAYCAGHQLKEISETFGIPFETLERKAYTDRWSGLRTEMLKSCATKTALELQSIALSPPDPFETGSKGTPGALVPTPGNADKLPATIQAKLDLLIANRAKNYNQADRMRSHLDKLLTDLVSGDLQMEQIFHNKGSIVRTKRQISPADLVNIATYARLVQEMTYRALGDSTAAEGKEGSNPNQGQTQAPAIIINLPGAIAQPREQRQIIDAARKAGAKIVDVEAVVAKEKALPLNGGENYTAPREDNNAGMFPHSDGQTQTEIPQPGAVTSFEYPPED